MLSALLFPSKLKDASCSAAFSCDVAGCCRGCPAICKQLGFLYCMPACPATWRVIRLSCGHRGWVEGGWMGGGREEGGWWWVDGGGGRGRGARGGGRGFLEPPGHSICTVVYHNIHFVPCSLLRRNCRHCVSVEWSQLFGLNTFKLTT